MRKSFWPYVVTVFVVCALVVTSCRKRIIHSNAPTPNNERMQAYTKITTLANTVPVGGTPATINENFRFFYDESNRVIKILYTSNDSFEIHKTIDFKYFGDTIAKVTTNTLNNSIVERDTFIVNSNGMIREARTPFLITEYEYYGKLMSRVKLTGTNYRNITAKGQTTYTSVNGDFLKNYYDGKLNIDFMNLKPWLTIGWKQDDKITTTWRHEDNDDDVTNGVLYLREGYNYHPVKVYVKDSNNVKDSVVFPGAHWVGESYHFYTEDANRIGDYLQLESFTHYGQNVYQNSHLVESITNSSFNAYIKYKIDAQSKITQTQVVETDSVLNKRTYIYDIQYETY